MDFIKCGEEDSLDVCELLFVDALYPDGKGGLLSCGVEAGSWTESWCLVRLDEGMVEGRVRSFQQQCRQDTQRKCLIRVFRRDQVTQKSDSQFCLLIRILH